MIGAGTHSHLHRRCALIGANTSLHSLTVLFALSLATSGPRRDFPQRLVLLTVSRAAQTGNRKTECPKQWSKSRGRSGSPCFRSRGAKVADNRREGSSHSCLLKGRIPLEGQQSQELMTAGKLWELVRAEKGQCWSCLVNCIFRSCVPCPEMRLQSGPGHHTDRCTVKNVPQ